MHDFRKPLGDATFRFSIQESSLDPRQNAPSLSVTNGCQEAMAKNVERILNKLQSLCDEKAAECTSDFAQHESWLLGTFKSNALRQLTRSKVELACPTSAKKQKTSEEPAEPTPADEVEPADMQVDAPEEAAPKEVRLSQHAHTAHPSLSRSLSPLCR